MLGQDYPEDWPDYFGYGWDYGWDYSDPDPAPSIHDDWGTGGASIPEASPEVVDAVDRFRAASLQYTNAAAQLRADEGRARAAGMGAEWDALANRASIAESYIQSVADAVAGAWGWAKGVFGLSGVRRGLGLLPAIPIAYAVIVAAIAWIVSVTSDIWKFHAKLQAVEGGASPDILQDSPSALADVGSIVKWGAIALVAFTVIPKLLK